jgi:hypothetical protein
LVQLYLGFFGIVTFSITIFLFVFLSPSLSFLFLYYNKLFSLPTILSVPSIHFLPRLCLPLLSFPNLSLHYSSFLHNHHPLNSLLSQLQVLKSLTHSLSTTTWEIHPNTEGPQNPAVPISFPPLNLDPLPTSSFSTTFTNNPSFYI